MVYQLIDYLVSYFKTKSDVAMKKIIDRIAKLVVD